MQLRQKHKSLEQHALDDAKDLARSEVRRITRRITDVVYVAIGQQFAAAQKKNEVIEVRPDLESIRTLVSDAVAAEFGLVKAQLVKGDDELPE